MERTSSGSTHRGGETGALHKTAATLRLKFRAFARCFVGSRDPERAPGGLSSPPPASLSLSLPDELLQEILVRLPPLPSTLPRASLVCKRWRRVISDPSFARRFRAHHRTPPLLGFIAGSGEPAFFPAMASPDRIPAAHFSPPLRPGECWRPLGCRHGLALFVDFSGDQVVVWHPITGGQWRVPLPPQLDVSQAQDSYTGAVLVAEGDNDGAGQLHGDDRVSSFKVVLCFFASWNRGWACVYESKSGKWGNVSSMPLPYPCFPEPAVLVGSALCWLLCWSGKTILEFDTERQSMAVTRIPSYTRSMDVADIQVVRTEDGGLGIALQAKQCIQVWGRKAVSDGDVEWVLQKTIWRDDLLSLKPSVDRLGSKREKWLSGILGYDEDTNVIVVATEFGTFMIQLDTIQVSRTGEYKVFRKLFHFSLQFGDRQLFEVCTVNGSSHTEWRAVVPLEQGIQNGIFTSVVIDGVIYFLCYDLHKSITFDDQVTEKDLIITFDLETEKWGAVMRGPLISIPDAAAQVFKDLPNIKQLTLANLNGSLAVVHGPAPIMDFWILMDSAKGLWVKQYTIQFEYYARFQHVHPLVVLGDGRVVLYKEDMPFFTDL